MNASAELLKELRIERSKTPSTPPPSRRGLWIGLAVAAAVALAALAAWALLGREQAPEVRTAPVVAIAAGNASASVLDASGYVVARRMATVSAKVTGRVKEVLIEEGMRVEEGQVLARLDPIDADAQRALAASQVAAAHSQADGVQAQLVDAEANARRLSELVGRQLVSRAQYEQAVAQRDSLRAQLATARRNAQVAGDQLHIATQGVDNTIVRAPFAGIVTAKAAQPGEIVSPLATGGYTRTGIGTIVDMESLEIEVEVGESYIGRVRPEMPVVATLNAYPEWRIPAEVIAIIPAADRGKATVKVRVALKEKDPRIVPDMGVRVSFLEAAPEAGQERPQGVRVPAAAIVQRAGAEAAFVLGGDDSVERRAVRAGMAMGKDRQVLSGLGAGETVVLDPPETLDDGDRVRVAAEGGTR
ncbi:efflux transporter periplasmic adaptor subunit [Pseudoxanthomonas broegbernensis]|uniref:Efflux transporter periplasmic adaptor subunit n=1 Tax=Pseudoxanthomonas broegbernensis TaxID=83619 RepID=A0A7V8GMX3_9GAMM|nr:efflux RND transporter periplasmic adaptor subunit [Pseudoxanthomonas broegbernensis]KAF1686728.1 efflux transporter periplasmic adaptor subunit [Pseudoxanthomonas broegbernensis]MBB6063505.1 RND family efflux transporter MFP subunit [Pseudoxanthomonas broegbernensis]